MLFHRACARVRPLSFLSVLAPVPPPTTTHHPSPTPPRRKPALVREGHYEEGQPPRATTSDGEERDVERVARMRP